MKPSTSQGRPWPKIDLRELEMKVQAEGQEWMRRRMEEELAEQAKAFSPGGGGKAVRHPAPETEDPNLGRRDRSARGVRA